MKYVFTQIGTTRTHWMTKMSVCISVLTHKHTHPSFKIFFPQFPYQKPELTRLVILIVEEKSGADLRQKITGMVDPSILVVWKQERFLIWFHFIEFQRRFPHMFHFIELCA